MNGAKALWVTEVGFFLKKRTVVGKLNTFISKKNTKEISVLREATVSSGVNPDKAIQKRINSEHVWSEFFRLS